LLIFGGGPMEEWGAKFRNPRLYANSGREDLYWQLRRRFEPLPTWRTEDTYDDRVGWTSQHIIPGTYAHSDEIALGDRRPILLFGDSFAACIFSAEYCYQGLMSRSANSEEFLLLNYGVGGFGLDQTTLMVRAALPRWRKHNPIVVVSIFVGDDLNRCALSFRQWPKPRFSLKGEGIALEPFEPLSPEEWSKRNPPEAFSYLWRWFVFGSRLPPWELRAHWAGYREPPMELREVCARLVRRLCTDLRQDGVDAFFLIFPDKDDLRRPDPYRWEELLVVQELKQAGFPYVSARRDLLAYLDSTGASAEAFYKEGHYNVLGTAIAFEAILRGIRGEFASL